MRIAAVVFALVFVTHAISPVATSADSRWTVPVALSLWRYGDTNLNEYLPVIRKHDYYSVECVKRGEPVRLGRDAVEHCTGALYTTYPPGGPVLASPLIYALQLGSQILTPAFSGVRTGRPMLDSLLAGDLVAAYGAVEVIVASAFVAATAALLYLIAVRYLSGRLALGFALVFAFATPAWSTASRALWQHTPSMLMAAATIWLLVQGDRKPWYVALAGLPVALSFTIRPTNAALVILITVYVFRHHRRQLPAYLAWAAPVALAFFLYNWSTYGAPFSRYYGLRPTGFTIQTYARGLATHLVSPSRGLFIFIPLAALSIFGMVKARRDPRFNPLAQYLAAWIVLHWLIVSSYVGMWWSGYSYGPRFFTDVLPAFMFFLIPVVQPATRPVMPVLVVFVLFGFWVHGRGAWRFAVHQWNTTPVSVDQYPERVWDWRDPQFLR
jgi:hypothetical protein